MCDKKHCGKRPSTQFSFPRADGATRSYCDEHARDLLLMGLKVNGTPT